jgi:hypothetical protein
LLVDLNALKPVNRCVVCSGYRIDQPDRPSPRFPPEKAGIVRNRIAQQLELWQMQAGDRAICGGAQGSDILFAECCVARNLDVELFIPLPTAEFVARSVYLEGTDWESRFFELCQHSQVTVKFQGDFLKNLPSEIQEIENVFARNNCWILYTAQLLAQELLAILVWDEQPTGDGPGGTSDFYDRLPQAGGTVAIINPGKL